METNSKVDTLLQTVSEEYDWDLSIHREAIEKELTADESSYQGLGIKLLSIAGGLLAAGFFLGFVGITLMSVPALAIFIGLLVMGCAIVLNKTSTNTVLDTLLISSYLASYAMVGFGMSQMRMDSNIIATALLLLAIITPVITSGYMLNFFSVLVASACLFSFVFINDSYETVHVYTLLFAAGYAWLSLSETELIAQNPPLNTRYMALRNGFLFAFIGLLCYLGIRELHDRDLNDGYLSGGIIILITGFVLYQVVDSLALTEVKSKALIYLMGGLMMLSAVFAPAICGALLIIFLSHHTGHRTGLIVGVIALIYFTSQYYYDLDYTLLLKSELMMASGAIFLSAWFILKKQLKRYEQN
ncbi:DUF4401 domain-containing protein [Mucilaginibacter sp.]|uniref:DUF4401 domain-containing protein n=1 Tax=Mucilaginibacter sp. TaxID=1882438 RepID=UPI003265AC94